MTLVLSNKVEMLEQRVSDLENDLDAATAGLTETYEMLEDYTNIVEALARCSRLYSAGGHFGLVPWGLVEAAHKAMEPPQ